ncbi:MAG: hypothetical protein ABF759_12390 [Acetobacter malorum]|uniref:hypothetical protein n=1 Tax=Acetobacter malorum TaxID=178901 RepID=UPI0039EC92DE
MSDRNETNHAAGYEACQANGVQTDIELRKWAIQTILLSPHPVPSTMEKLGSSSLRLASFAKHGTLFPELHAVVDTSLFGRRIKTGNKDVSGLKRIKNFALIARKFIYFALKFFYSWFHKNSSFLDFGKERMDDSGGCSNVPPASCEKVSSNNTYKETVA